MLRVKNRVLRRAQTASRWMLRKPVLTQMLRPRNSVPANQCPGIYWYTSRTASTSQHSAAQSPLHKAANRVRTDQSTYQNKYYVHACGVRVLFLEHGALGICTPPVCTYLVPGMGFDPPKKWVIAHRFAPKMLDHLRVYVCHSVPFFL